MFLFSWLILSGRKFSYILPLKNNSLSDTFCTQMGMENQTGKGETRLNMLFSPTMSTMAN